MARIVTKTFGQSICGFDLLRTDGKSYVIDVNGWSFVKGNAYYYDKCASVLRAMFLEAAKAKEKMTAQESQANLENQWKLKGFFSVMRHGDRTPKQKIKVGVFLTSSQTIALFQICAFHCSLEWRGRRSRHQEARKLAKSTKCLYCRVPGRH